MGLSLDPISGAAVMRVRWRAVLPLLLAAMFVTAFAGPASADNESYKVEQGLAVYLGVMPAGIVQGHPAGHPEATMHGGAPSGLHQYHILIAIFDADTGGRVENAKVTANVSGLGHLGARNVKLEPMTIAGTVTYGNFIELPGDDRYDMRFDISVPGRDTPVRVVFTYEHLQ
jgi:hypothetical protein